MTTQVEYALLAANSYAVKPIVTSDANVIPIPDGWVSLESKINDATGFTARAYQNTQTGEICIAYTGTTFEGTVNNVGDWLLGNITAGSGAVLAPQVIDAAKFYLDVLQASPGANITFTGHSLGGGLASLMAVYFDRPATVFDEAPFEKSADSALVANGLKTVLAASGYTLPDAFSGYVALDPLFGTFIPSPTRVARESNVSAIYVKDEILSLAQTAIGRIVLPLMFAWNPALFELALNVANISGSELAIDAHATSGNGWDVGIPGVNGDPIDLHSMPLLTAFLQSPEFLTLCQSNPEVLQEIFTSQWNVNPKDPDRRNFLNLMVQRQAQGEDPLGVFATDIGRLQGELATGVLKAVLVELGIDLQYAQGLEHANGITAGAFDPVFRSLAGGIQIEHKAADDQWVAKGFAQLDRELRNAHPELFAINVDRYLLATQGDFVATAQSDGKRDLMLGGLGNDTLTSGDGNDLIVGGAGSDTLDGGTGYDTYIVEGSDTIRDSDGLGILKDNAGNIISGAIQKNADGTYTYLSNLSVSVTLDTNYTLTLSFADGTAAVIENFTSGNLGLQLVDTATLAALTGNALDNFIGTTVYNRDPGNSDVFKSTLAGGTAQLNSLMGGNSANTLEGGAGSDILSGGAGDDLLYADTQVDRATAIANGNTQTGINVQGDWLAGGTGDDTPISGADNDILSGGEGSDLLIAGAGDDYLPQYIWSATPSYQIGSTNWYHSSADTFDWSVTPQADGSALFQTIIEYALGNSPAAGNDIIYAGDGNDHVWAGSGSDIVYGEGGADILNGEGGNDVIFGGTGDDTLYGDASYIAASLHRDDYLDGGDTLTVRWRRRMHAARYRKAANDAAVIWRAAA